MLTKLLDQINLHRDSLKQLSRAIWEHPEIAWHEKFAAATLRDYLTERGFKVSENCCGLETAFCCETGSGDGPTVAIAAEYDALPEIGHGCGHNLICTTAVAAFLALSEILKSAAVPGKVLLLGTPAEEGGGGKVKMANAGILDGVDAAIMLHPSSRNQIDAGSTANAGFEVIFHGKSAHAAASPELGVNALDAVTLLFAAVNAYRQQLPRHALIHGIINNGGAAPNIIPETAGCRFYLRTEKETFAPQLEKRFMDMVKGAELMTGCTAEVMPFREAYRARKPNAAMNEAFACGMESFGCTVVYPKDSGRGSSDFGNFAQLVPGIHPYFAIVPEGEPAIAAHSPEFRDAAISDFAFDNGLRAAASMAAVVYRFITEKDFRLAVQADFAK
ncbi:MAG: M20 family metallopeptidase [Lentisphaeria bacterium]|nr:M20 family metallopeptidase [Lentisphaeria bacterium]